MSEFFAFPGSEKPPKHGPAQFSLGTLIERDNPSEIAEGEQPIMVSKADELSKQLNNDALTGLLNREGLKQLYEEYTALGPNKFGLLFIDLKDFKKFNDTNDNLHDGGDKLLQGFATGLERFVRSENGGKGDRIYGSRIGGDEFVAVVDLRTVRHNEDLSPEQRLEAARKNLIKRAQEEMLAGSGVDISVGGAVWDGNKSLEQLLREADAEMYEHKRQQREASGSYR